MTTILLLEEILHCLGWMNPWNTRIYHQLVQDLFHQDYLHAGWTCPNNICQLVNLPQKTRRNYKAYLKSPPIVLYYGWWFRNPANQWSLVVYPVYKDLYIPAGALSIGIFHPPVETTASAALGASVAQQDSTRPMNLRPGIKKHVTTGIWKNLSLYAYV